MATPVKPTDNPVEDAKDNPGINMHFQIFHEKDKVMGYAGGGKTFELDGKTKNFMIPNDQMPEKDGIAAHTDLPGNANFANLLSTLPAMTPAPTPTKLDQGNK